MLALFIENEKTLQRFKFSRPLFNIIVLYCDEGVSVQRQMKRGQAAVEKYKILEAIGDLQHGSEARTADLDENYAKKKI